MISFESRILAEYKIKNSKVDTLARSIMTARDPKSEEVKGASNFLDILIGEMDRFYEENSEILSTNGKRPHASSRLPESEKWVSNIEKFYEKNPRRRPRK